MAEEATQETTLSVYVNAGTTPMGRALIQQLVADGHSVISRVSTGADATIARADGALPVYPNPHNAADIANMLKMAEVNMIVNLAPRATGTLPYFKTDWEAVTADVEASTLALVEAAKAVDGAFVIHTSFAMLYADSAELVGEDAPSRSGDLFAPLIRAEQAVLAAGGCVLRMGTLYSGDSPALKQLDVTIKRGRPMLTGAEGAVQNWVHTDDAFAALNLAIATRPAGEVFNIVDDAPISAHAFLGMFAKGIGLDMPTALPMMAARPMFGKAHINVISTSVPASNAKAKETLGWAPKHPSFETSLDALLLDWRAVAPASS